jgi:hypothetical protein
VIGEIPEDGSLANPQRGGDFSGVESALKQLSGALGLGFGRSLLSALIHPLFLGHLVFLQNGEGDLRFPLWS